MLLPRHLHLAMLSAFTTLLAGCPTQEPTEDEDAGVDVRADVDAGDDSDADASVVAPADATTAALVYAKLRPGEGDADDLVVGVRADGRPRAIKATVSAEGADDQVVEMGSPELAIATFQTTFSDEDPPEWVCEDACRLEMGDGFGVDLAPRDTIAEFEDKTLHVERFVDGYVVSVIGEPEEIEAFVAARVSATIVGGEATWDAEPEGLTYLYRDEVYAQASGRLSVEVGVGEDAAFDRMEVSAREPAGPAIVDVTTSATGFTARVRGPFDRGVQAVLDGRIEPGLVSSPLGAGDSSVASSLAERVFVAPLGGPADTIRVVFLDKEGKEKGSTWICEDDSIKTEGGELCGETDHFRVVPMPEPGIVVATQASPERTGDKVGDVTVGVTGALAGVVSSVRLEINGEADDARIVEAPLVREYHTVRVEREGAFGSSPADFDLTLRAEDGAIYDRVSGVVNSPGEVFAANIIGNRTRVKQRNNGLYHREAAPTPPVDTPPAIVSAWIDREGDSAVAWAVVAEGNGQVPPSGPAVSVPAYGREVISMNPVVGRAVFAGPKPASLSDDTNGDDLDYAEFRIFGQELTGHFPDGAFMEFDGDGFTVMVDTRGEGLEIVVEGQLDALERVGVTNGADAMRVNGESLAPSTFMRGWTTKLESVPASELEGKPVAFNVSLEGEEVQDVSGTLPFGVEVPEPSVWLDDDEAILTIWSQEVGALEHALVVRDDSDALLREGGGDMPTAEERVFGGELEAVLTSGETFTLEVEVAEDSLDRPLFNASVNLAVDAGWAPVDSGRDDGVERFVRVDLMEGSIQVRYSAFGANAGPLQDALVSVSGNASGEPLGLGTTLRVLEVARHFAIEDDAIADAKFVSFSAGVGGDDDALLFSYDVELGAPATAGGARIWALVTGFGKGTKKNTTKTSARPELQ